MKPMAYFFIDRSNERPHKAAFPALRFHPPDPARHPGPVTPLYPAREWQGLTDEDIKEIWLSGKDHGDDWLDVQGIARAVEDALRSKNTWSCGNA
jgi:hypothetical protein